MVLQDVEGAVAYVKGVISDLLMNRMDLSLLVVTKVLLVTDWSHPPSRWRHIMSDISAMAWSVCRLTPLGVCNG
jgi:hypothetical protein